MRFEFATANRIIFGAGCIRELAPAVSSFGQQAFFVVGRSSERASAVLGALADAGLRVVEFHVPGEPTLELILAGLASARSSSSDMVIAMGGGSALDAGKAIAALLPNPGTIYDYLEVVGKGQVLQRPSLPFAAIPTTAGTGSEATRNAVLTVVDQGVKVSLRGPSMLPRLSVVDPELTFGLPTDVTAASGLDALTQLIEPFLSNASNPITDVLCRDGLRRAARSLRSVFRNGADSAARADMALAALFSGMALANARLGAVHGFAGPIGGLFPAPHGATCARLLPSVVQVNLTAIRQREPESGMLARFSELARLLTGCEDAVAEDGVRWLAEISADLSIPPLRTYGMTRADFPEVISRASKASSMKGNPAVLSEAELSTILELAL